MNNPEVVEVNSIALARAFLLGNLIKASTKHFRGLEKPFLKMTKGEQEGVLWQVQSDIREAVNEAIEIIVSDNRVTFRAGCEAVAFKKDGVKVNLNLANTEAAHAMADVAGGVVLVVIEDSARYLDPGDAINGEDEQASIPV